jgi:hypothetical protein
VALQPIKILGDDVRRGSLSPSSFKGDWVGSLGSGRESRKSEARLPRLKEEVIGGRHQEPRGERRAWVGGSAGCVCVCGRKNRQIS